MPFTRLLARDRSVAAIVARNPHVRIPRAARDRIAPSPREYAPAGRRHSSRTSDVGYASAADPEGGFGGGLEGPLRVAYRNAGMMCFANISIWRTSSSQGMKPWSKN